MGGKYTVTEIRERANEEVGLIGEERVVRAGSKSTNQLWQNIASTTTITSDYRLLSCSPPNQVTWID